MGEWITLKRPKYSSDPTLHIEYGEWAEKRIAELKAENLRLRKVLSTEISYHAGSETHYRAERMRKALEGG